MAEVSPNQIPSIMDFIRTGETNPRPVDIQQGIENIGNLNTNAASTLGQTTETPEDIAENRRLRASMIVNSPQELERIAAARKYGNSLADDPVVHDLENMNYMELIDTYGRDIADKAHLINGQTAADFDEADRNSANGVQRTGDAINSVATGATAVVGSGAALILGAVNAEAGTAVAEGTTKLTNNIRQMRSLESQKSDAAAQVQMQLNREDNQREFEANGPSAFDYDKAPADEFMRAAQLAGSNWISNMSVLKDNPDVLLDQGLQGIGSLGPSVKVVGAVNRLATGWSNGARVALAGSPQSTSLALNSIAADAAQRLSIPIGVGLTEASGTYAQTAEKVMNMTFEELAFSEDFNRYIDTGWSPEEARIKVANNQGLEAAGRSFPNAAAVGVIAGKFEAAPLRSSTSAAQVGRNTLSQTIEEGLQGGISEIAGNASLREVDSTINLADNVGEAVATGMASGAIMAGVIGAPAVTKDTLLTVGGAVVRTTGSGVNRLIEARDTQRDNKSPVGRRAVREAVAGIKNIKSNIETVIAEETQSVTQGNEPNTQATQSMERINNVLTIAPEKVEKISENIKKFSTATEDNGQPTEPNDRINILNNLVNSIDAGTMTPDEQNEAALFIFEELKTLQEFVREETPAEIAALDENNVVRRTYEDTKEALLIVQGSETFNNALGIAMKVDVSEVVAEEITPQVIQDNITLAEANPSGVNPETVEKVIQSENVNEDQKKRLKAAAELSAAMSKLVEEKSKIEKTKDKTSGNVERDISFEGYDMTRGRGEILPSLNSFFTDITSSIQDGDTNTAQTIYNRLGNFALHMNNKMSALNESIENGSSISEYNKMNAEGVFDGTKRTIVGRNNTEAAINLAKVINKETSTVIHLYDKLAEIYPELKQNRTKKLVSAELSPLFEKVVNKEDSKNEREDKKSNTDTTTANKNGETKDSTPVEETKTEPEDKVSVVEKQEVVEEEENSIDPFKKSRIDMASYLEELNTLPDVTEEIIEMDVKQKVFVYKRLEPMLKFLGFKTEDIVQDVVLLDDTKRPNGFFGYSLWDSKTFAMSPEFARSLDKIKGQHAMLHEVFHLIDNAVRVKRGSSKLASDMDTLKENGEVYNEVVAAMDEVPLLKTYFEYAMSFSDPTERANELFADLGALSLMGVDLMQERFPYGNVLVNKIVTEAGGKIETIEKSDGTILNKGRNRIEELEGQKLQDRRAEQSSKLISTTSTSRPSILVNKTVKRLMTYKEGKSKLNEMSVEELIDSTDTSNETKENIKSVIKYFGGRIIDAMNSRLDTVNYSSTGKGKTVNQFLEDYYADGKSGDKINARFRNTLIVDQTTKKYDRELLEKATVAALAWAMNMNKGKGNLTKDRVAKILGIDKSYISSVMVNTMNSGVYARTAKEELGRVIMDFWGVEANKNASESEIRGLSEGLAAELLLVMADKSSVEFPLYSFDKVSFKKDGKDVDVIVLVPNTEAQKRFSEGMKSDTNVLLEAVNPRNEQQYYFDKVPAVKDTQKRNSLTKLTNKEKQQVETANRLVFKANTVMVNLFESINKERFAILLGKKKLDDKQYVKGHLESLKGKNAQIDYSIANLENQIDKMKKRADLDNSNWMDTIIHYSHEIIKSGRIMMNGWNPQSDKVSRGMFVSTPATLDMTDAKDIEMFWTTVAQALGKNIEQKSTIETEKESRDDLENLYAQSVAIMENQLLSGDVMTDQEFNIMKSELGDVSDVKIIQAIAAVAELNIAERIENPTERETALKEFNHTLSVEADGKTDGPINFMMHYMSGNFYKEQITNFAKGGIFLNSIGKSLNDHYTEDKDDLYRLASNSLTKILRESLSDLEKNDPKLGDRKKAMLDFMTRFGEVVKVGDDYLIDREEVKNPLTITGYGSGKYGIADNIANIYAGKVYEKMSQMLSGVPFEQIDGFQDYTKEQFNNDLDILFGSTVKQIDGQLVIDGNGKVSISNLSNFEFDRNHMFNFTNTLLHLYVEDMDAAIDTTMGNSRVAMDMLFKSTNIQSTVYKRMVEQAVSDKLNVLRKQGILGDTQFLSRNQYMQILKDMSKFAPIIKSEDQEINLATAENEQSDYQFSLSMDEKFRQKGTLPKPKDAGVSVAAMLTINRGDGRLIQLALTGNKEMPKILHIFDGVEMAADKAKEYNEIINGAAAQMLMENPFTDAVNSFSEFMRIKSEWKSYLTSEDISALSKITGVEFTIDTAQEILNEMIEVNKSIEVRKQVMSEMTYSIDKMAGTQSPYTNYGVEIVGDPIKWMQNRYEEIYTEKYGKITQVAKEGLTDDVIDDGDVFTGKSSPIGKIQGDNHLDKINDLFTAKVDDFLLNQTDTAIAKFGVNVSVPAYELANEFSANGYGFSVKQKLTFSKIMESLATEMEINSASLVRVQKIYDDLMKEFDSTNFLDDPSTATDAQLIEAQQKFNTLTSFKTRNGRNQPNYMAAFVALSQVDTSFREALSKVKLEKDETKGGTFDERLERIANNAIDFIGNVSSGASYKDKTVIDSVDRLAIKFGTINSDAQYEIEKIGNSLLSKGDHVGSSMLEKLDDKVADLTSRGIASTESKALKALYQSVDIASQFLSTKRANSLAETVISFSDGWKSKLLIPFREQLSEVIGMTDSNKAMFMMVNKAKYAVSSIRQNYREKLPKVLDSKFTRKLTKGESSSLHKMLTTDIGVLFDGNTTDTVISMLSDKTERQKQISILKDEIKKLSLNQRVENIVIEKSEQLATFIMTGDAGINLVQNAYAIAQLTSIELDEHMNTDAMEKAVDKLVTILAIDKISSTEMKNIENLLKTEKKGIEFLVYYQKSLRESESGKSVSDKARINGRKGYLPSESQSGSSLLIAEDSKSNDLLKMGYKRIGDYKGIGPLDAGKRGYYYSSTGEQQTYSQGAMQTVQTSFNGVDALSGFNIGGDTSTIITGKKAIQIANKLSGRKNVSNFEGLIPVFSPDGSTIAFQRSVHPDKLALLKRDTNVTKMIGSWVGRQIEEELGAQFNNALVDLMHQDWMKAKGTDREKEFISPAKTDDKIYNDTWSTIPRDTKEYIAEVFDAEPFMVRRSVINNTLGYRNASVDDLFKGTSRFDEQVEKAITRSVQLMVGDTGYRLLVTGEKGLQTAVSTAKNLIVVKSIFVPAMNMTSNVVQLLSKGVSIRDILGMKNKFIEIDAHLKNIDRRIELEAELKAATRNPNKTKRINAAIKSIDDADRKLSIYPLLEAGEFSTISEGITEMDAALMDNNLTNWIENQVEKLPTGLQTLGKNFIISNDTALYKGLNRSVQYGDFLGKAILYDHLVKNKKLTKQEALEVITEEFVNFNLESGRARNYAESMGLTWFWAFKIRSMKVALRMAREHPFRALALTVGVPQTPIDSIGIGSPLTDNFASVWWDDRLGYSTGWGMMWRAPSLNPWINLFS